MLKLLITCEHGGNTVPAAYQKLFARHKKLLNSHRAYDIGAIALAKVLAALADFTQFTEVTRLLIELNRSPHHPKLFSEITKNLSPASKQAIITKYYLPYRETLANEIRQFAKAGHQVLHIAVHSFTPELNGTVRNADIGFLYDPSRPREKAFASSWRTNLGKISELRLRNNYPYLGKTDGLPTYLRKQFTNNEYAAIELETNQALWQQTKSIQKLLRQLLLISLNQTLQQTTT